MNQTSSFFDQKSTMDNEELRKTGTVSTYNRRHIDGWTDDDLDIEIFLHHLLQRTIFEFVRLGDQVEVADIRLVGRRRYGVAQHWSDPAVNPIATSDTI